MVDFRSSSERRSDQQKTQQVEQDYRRAFEAAQTEINDLKSRLSEVEIKNNDLQERLSEVAEMQAESIRSVRSQIEAGIAKLTEDNQQMHTLIQSAQSEDLKLVEQMDQNHRERLESIMRLVDKKGVSDG